MSPYWAIENKDVWQSLHGCKDHIGQSIMPEREMNKHNRNVTSRKCQRACGWQCQSKADRGKVHPKSKGKGETFSTGSDNKADWMHTLKSFQLETVQSGKSWEVKVECEGSLQER